MSKTPARGAPCRHYGHVSAPNHAQRSFVQTFLKDANKQFITTWRQLAVANWPGLSCDASLVVDPYSYPATVVGYAAYARAMLAATYNAGKTDALASYYTWTTMTPLKNDPAFGGILRGRSCPPWRLPEILNPNVRPGCCLAQPEFVLPLLVESDVGRGSFLSGWHYGGKFASGVRVKYGCASRNR